MSGRASGVLPSTYGSAATGTPAAPRPTWSRATLAPLIPLQWLYGQPTGALVATPQPPPATPPTPPGGCDTCA